MQQIEKSQAKMPFFSIAPMIDISNTHFRYFIRLITRQSIVYTQMLHHDAIIHSHQFLLPFNKQQHPIVLQIGGSDPEKLAKAAILGQKYGYDEINLNVGCPSPRVQKGSFGACLMKEPILVKECMESMIKSVNIKCTVKCRLGVDQFDSYQFVKDFVSIISNNGQGPLKHFVIHARKAFLKGLNPAQNRSIPPLMYDRVYRLKQDFPQLSFQINGGIKQIHLAKKIVDENNLQGCMVGRLAYQNPYELITVDEIFYGMSHYKQIYQTDDIARYQILTQYANYIERLQNKEIKDQFGHIIHKPNPSVLVKPILNLYNGEKNAGKYRRYLSDLAKLKEGPLHIVIREAIKLMQNRFKYTNIAEEEETQEQKLNQKYMLDKTYIQSLKVMLIDSNKNSEQEQNFDQKEQYRKQPNNITKQEKQKGRNSKEKEQQQYEGQ